MIGCKGGKEGGDDGPAMGKEASKDTPRGMNLMAVYPALFNRFLAFLKAEIYSNFYPNMLDSSRV